MKLDDLLRYLIQPGVVEVALQSGRLPCIAVEGKFRPITEQPLSLEDVMRIIAATGGARQASELSEQPTHWTLQSKTAGNVEANAIRKGEAVLLRFRRAARKSVRPASSRGLKPRATTKPPPRGGASALALDSEIPAVLGNEHKAENKTESPLVSRHELELDMPPMTTKSAALELVADPRATSTTSAGAPDALDELVAIARKAKASDVHLVGGRPMLLRIGGDLTPEGAVMEPDAVEELLLARMPPHARENLDHLGACVFALADARHGRARVNVSKQRTGLGGALRLVPKTVPTLSSLGLPEKLAQLVQQRHGFIVVSGPPGHGKTTTVAALVDAINRERAVHVVTIEDPIEHVHTRKRALITQREVGTHAASFERALRTAMRMDPDVMVVGSVRDAESMRHALSALEKGHLVIATVDAPSAAKTLERMIDFFLPTEQPRVRRALSGTLHLVVNQRLVPTQKHDAMVAAVEVLPASTTLAKLVRDGELHEIPAMQQRGKALGLVRLDESLADLVRTGRADPEVARTHAESPDTFGSKDAGPRAPNVLGKIVLKKAGV